MQGAVLWLSGWISTSVLVLMDSVEHHIFVVLWLMLEDPK